MVRVGAICDCWSEADDPVRNCVKLDLKVGVDVHATIRPPREACNHVLNLRKDGLKEDFVQPLVSSITELDNSFIELLPEGFHLRFFQNVCISFSNVSYMQYSIRSHLFCLALAIFLALKTLWNFSTGSWRLEPTKAIWSAASVF